MKGLFLYTLQSKWKFVFYVVLFSLIMIEMYVAIYPTLASQSKSLEAMLASFPPEVWGALGIKDGAISISTFEGFMSMEFYSLTWPLISIIVFVNLGINAIAGEIEAGTMYLLLANPMSRLKIFFSKYFAGVVLLFTLCASVFLGMVVFANLHGIHTDLMMYARVLAYAFSFCLAGFGISLMVGSLLEKSKGSGLVIGLFLAMYFLNALSALKSELEFLHYASVFHYVDFAGVLNGGVLKFANVGILLGIALVTTAVGAIVFNKRDI